MNGLVFYIGLGLGLALAAGLRPFMPALLAGALASSGVLGVELRARRASTSCRPVGGCSRWCVAFVVALRLLRLRLVAERLYAGPLGAALGGHWHRRSGALLFAGTLAAHGDVAWPGQLGGASAAVIAQAGLWPCWFARAHG